ncbi:MAG: ABC transporter substrate-binding protein [Actinomycetota bacterium]|nr:ABC transporter substrate-binding protein [Actinomycetota bacterium]
MRKHRKLALGAAALALTLLAAACGKSSPGGGGTGKACNDPVTVGVSGDYAESQIMAELYGQILAANGCTVSYQLHLGTREISDKALESGKIDIKPEYVAYELPALDPNADTSGTADQVAARLKPLVEKKGWELLDFTPANDTNAFVVTKATADKYSLTTMSDLAKVAGQLTLGGPPECPQRPFCIPGLKSTYGIEFGKFQPIGACDSATANALVSGAVDVALLCSTQSIIAKEGLVVLQDDKNLQAAGNIAPIVKKGVLTSSGEDLLNKVSAGIEDATITGLSEKVEIEHQDPADVAKAYLSDQGLT